MGSGNPMRPSTEAAETDGGGRGGSGHEGLRNERLGAEKSEKSNSATRFAMLQIAGHARWPVRPLADGLKFRHHDCPKIDRGIQPGSGVVATASESWRSPTRTHPRFRLVLLVSEYDDTQ